MKVMKHLYEFDNEVGAILDESVASETVICHCEPLYMHIIIIWGLWNTLYVFDNEVWAILDGSILNHNTSVLFAPQKGHIILGSVLSLAQQD